VRPKKKSGNQGEGHKRKINQPLTLSCRNERSEKVGKNGCLEREERSSGEEIVKEQRARGTRSGEKKKTKALASVGKVRSADL